MANTSYIRATSLLMAVVAAASVAVLVGYRSASAQIPDPPPGDSPTVISTFPTDGATNVDRDANIKAKFSEKMLKSTVNDGTVRVEQAVSGPGNPDPPGGMTVKYNNKKKTAIVSQDRGFALQPNTEYRVTIEGGEEGVKDKAGNPMASDFTFTFTTGGS
jgi:hypothetical protein